MKKIVAVIISISVITYSAAFFLITRPRLIQFHINFGGIAPDTMAMDAFFFALILIGCAILYFTFKHNKKVHNNQ